MKIKSLLKRGCEVLEICRKGYTRTVFAHLILLIREAFFTKNFRSTLFNYLIELESMYNIVVEEDYGKIKEFTPSPGDVVYDVGANVGFYTIWASKNMKGRGKIYAIEPLSYNYKRLLFNLKKNNVKIAVPLKVAISDKDGYAEMLRPAASTGSTLFESHLKLLESKYGSKEEVLTKEVVKVTTLDAVTSRFSPSRINLLKIDIEGAELLALKGGNKTLDITEKLIIEVHDVSCLNKIKEKLYEKGFEIENVFCTSRWREVLIYAKKR